MSDNPLKAILEASTPKAESVTIDVAGTACTFRVVTDLSELNQLGKGAADFAEKHARSENKGTPYEGSTPCDPEVARMAFILTELSIAPKWNLPFALKLAKTGGHVFRAVFDQIDAFTNVSVKFADHQMIEQAKKNSEPIPDGETNSS